MFDNQADKSKDEKISQDNLSKIDLTDKDFAPISNIINGIDQVGSKLGDIFGSLSASTASLEGQVNSISRLFAGSQNLAQITRETLNAATPSVVALGGSIDDVAKIQSGILSNLHTQASLNADQFDDLYASAALVGDSTTDLGTNAANIAKLFADAGYGINNVGQEMTGILNTAKELGVTSKSVYEGIKNNITYLDKFNFEGGVQGMAKMAAQASLLRIDMKTTLGLADQLFEPDKAIQMSAAFQRLGVQVNSLLDPYKLMDMARNDPEKLQEAMGEALKSLTYFDEKTQSMRILPGAQGQMRALAQETGMNIDQMMQWAKSAGDLDRKMKEITFNPNFADEDSKKMIAGMAQLGEKGTAFEGKYVVKYQDEKGESQTKLVSEIKPEDLDVIKEGNKPAKSAVDLQIEANGYLKTMANLAKARQGVGARAIAADPNYVKSIQELAKLTSVVHETLNSAAGVRRELTASGDKSGFLTTSTITQNIGNLTTSLSDIMKKVAEGNMSGAMSDITAFGDKLKDIGKGALERVPGDFAAAQERYGTNIPVEQLGKLLDNSQVNEVLKSLNLSVDDIKNKILGTPTTPSSPTTPTVTTTPTTPNIVTATTPNIVPASTPNIVTGAIPNIVTGAIPNIVTGAIPNIVSQTPNVVPVPQTQNTIIPQVISTNQPTVTTNTNTTNSTISLEGKIDVNVNDTEFKQSLLRILNESDVKSQIKSIVDKQTNQNNNIVGSPSTNKNPVFR